MPELEASSKTTTTASSSRTARGISHHFFSSLRNRRISLSKDIWMIGSVAETRQWSIMSSVRDYQRWQEFKAQPPPATSAAKAIVENQNRVFGPDRSRWVRIGPDRSRQVRILGQQPGSYRELSGPRGRAQRSYLDLAGAGGIQKPHTKDCKALEAEPQISADNSRLGMGPRISRMGTNNRKNKIAVKEK